MHPSRSGVWPAALRAALLLLLAWGPPAGAQSVAINSPSHGELLLDTSSFYRGSPYYDVEVRGVVGVPPGQRSKYALYVHGRRVSIGGGYFQERVWIGPWAGPAGPVPSWYPYLAFLTDPQHIQRPIVVELVEKATKAVVARQRIVLFDGRFDGGLDPKFGGTSVPESMHVQIPGSGLDALEETHRTSLPDPTLAAFNQVLRDRATGISFEAQTATGTGAADKACIPLGDAPPEFLLTSAYVQAFAQAEARYLAYQTVQSSQSFAGVTGLPGAIIALGVQGYLTAECVQQQPQVYSTWELCVGRIETELTDLSTAGILDVNLSYGAGVMSPATADDILADVDLGRIDGTVEGRLRNVFIRWSEKPLGCSPTFMPLPRETLSDEELLSDAKRAAWASCPGLQVDAAAAHLGPTEDGAHHTDPLVFDANSAHFDVLTLADPELLGVSGAAGVQFTLDDSRTQNPDSGTCAEAFVRDTVKELLGSFYPAMEDAIGEAWDEGAAATQQARALAALLSPLNVGTYEPVDHQLDLEYSDVWTLEPSYSLLPPYDGLVGVLGSDAKLRLGFDVIPPPATWVYSPPGDLIDLVSTDGLDAFGDPFDIAFGITTGMLNQVLRERSAAEWMRFDWKPTWNDLGVPPPKGVRPDDQAVLDGGVLAAAVDPALATLGSSTLTVVAQPTLLPFTWIPPDPFSISPWAPPFEWGRAPLTYQLSQFLVDVYSSDPANPHPIQLSIDFYDGDFGFGFGQPQQNLLVPSLGTDQWTTTALEWNVPGCDRAPMTEPPTPPATPAPVCGGRASSALGKVFIPLLEHNLLGMLSDVPAPLRFDAAGAGSTRRFARNDTFVGEQRVIFYGRLE
jgi:hypothetical protein